MKIDDIKEMSREHLEDLVEYIIRQCETGLNVTPDYPEHAQKKAWIDGFDYSRQYLIKLAEDHALLKDCLPERERKRKETLKEYDVECPFCNGDVRAEKSGRGKHIVYICKYHGIVKIITNPILKSNKLNKNKLWPPDNCQHPFLSGILTTSLIVFPVLISIFCILYYMY